MRKLFRLIQETFAAIRLYQNPWVYFRERLKRTKVPFVEIRLRNGIRYALRSGSNEVGMLNEIWNLKIYDPLLKAVKPGGVIIDIGAAIGVFSVKAAKTAAGVKVFSYEPFPKNFQMLERNISLNGLEKNVVPSQKAVYTQRGMVDLYARSGDSGSPSLRPQGSSSVMEKVEVSCVTLNDIFQEHAIETCDFLKMDCEGAEEEILLTAPRSLFSKIKTITLEWHYDINKMSIESFQEFLAGVGYQSRYDKPTLTLYCWK